MTTDDNDFSSKSSKIFQCKKCNYTTTRKSQYTRHISTAKHQKQANNNASTTLLVPKVPEHYSCEFCEKTFKDRAGVWRHKKSCKLIIASTENNISFDKEFVMSVLKQNSEMLKSNEDIVRENCELKNIMIDTQQQMLEVFKNGTNNITNSNNRSFNLNFFLNEQCKDAMNIMDFVESLKLKLGDLETMGEIGYVNGMTDIIVKNLNALDVYKRPIHSSDSKRDVIYVKDENRWERDEDNKPRLKKAIKHIAHKNSKLLLDYKEKHPDCVLATSNHNDNYNKLMLVAYDGNENNENRIIKKISKEISIEKIDPIEDV